MTRVLNFVCIVATAFACLALNHVSDQTRVAQAQLRRTSAQIVAASDALKILQADWELASTPAHIQALAAVHLGLADTATVQVASLELLPHRGDTSTFAASAVANASMVAPTINPHLNLLAARAGE